MKTRLQLERKVLDSMLLELHRNPRQYFRFNEISRLSGVRKSTLQRVLSRLVKRGMILKRKQIDVLEHANQIEYAQRELEKIKETNNDRIRGRPTEKQARLRKLGCKAQTVYVIVAYPYLFRLWTGRSIEKTIPIEGDHLLRPDGWSSMVPPSTVRFWRKRTSDPIS